jgi:uncharacterized NAD-dependent epimerase/dehydratase family protein
VGVALNTHDATAEVVDAEIRRIKAEFGVPVVDPLRDGCDVLLAPALKS